jgi:hypothetical protein
MHPTCTDDFTLEVTTQANSLLDVAQTSRVFSTRWDSGKSAFTVSDWADGNVDGFLAAKLTSQPHQTEMRWVVIVSFGYGIGRERRLHLR